MSSRTASGRKSSAIRQGRAAKVNGPNDVPVELEEQSQALCSILVVVRNEDSPGHGVPGRRLARGLQRGRRGRGNRQPHEEFTALAEAGAARLDRAAMQLGEAFDQRKSESQSTFASTVDAVDLGKHVEHAADRLGCDAYIRRP